jgi:hypothetical protein
MPRRLSGGRRVHLLTTLGCALVLGACAAQAVAPSPTATATGNPAPTASVAATLSAGTYEGNVIGAGRLPSYWLNVPAGWTSDRHFTVKPIAPAVLGVSVWDVGRVPSDPCHWRHSLADPGPTVDDLVQALVAQRGRNATAPTEASIGVDRHAWTGTYLEWSVPADAVVTGDADFAGCDDSGEGHTDYVSWEGSGGGQRYQQVAGQVDQLWILEVNGRRVVVDATYSPDTTTADRRELGHVVESLRFDAP